MHSFCAAVPARVIGLPRVGAHIHSWLLQLLNLLIVEALLNVEELLANLVLMWMTCCADRSVPCWLLGAQEVAINLVLHCADHVFGALMVRVIVVFPSREARLVLTVIHLTVMN